MAVLSSIPMISSTSALNKPELNRGITDVLSSIKFERAEIIRLQFPNPTPLVWNAIKKSGGKKPTVKILRIYTDAGIIGETIPKGPDSVILGEVMSRIKGQNLLQIENMWHRMYFHERKPVAKGLYIHALGSVDLALWDIIGKAMQLPVHRILGTYREEIPVYAAGGYYSKSKGIPELVAEMEGYIKQGFQAVKMKVGGLPITQDVERVKAVRKALGPEIDIMIDANNAYKAYEAIRLGRALEDQQLFWFEEPVIPDDFQGCAEVRAALDTPIVAGENEYTRWGARDLIEHSSADILNLDTIKAGGITEYRKIAALASAWHIPVAPHGFAHMGIHIVASTPNALILESYPLEQRNFNPALPSFPVKNGMVTAPDLPGLGMEVDPGLIKKHKVG